MPPHATGAVAGPLSTTSLPPLSALPLLLPDEEEPLVLPVAVSVAASVMPLLLPELLLDEPLPDPLLLVLPLLLALPGRPLLLPELLVEPPPEPLALAVPLSLPGPVLASTPPSPMIPALLSDPHAAVTAIPTETKKKIFELFMSSALLTSPVLIRKVAPSFTFTGSDFSDEN